MFVLRVALSACLVVPASAQTFNIDVGDDVGVPSFSYGAAALRPGLWNASTDATMPPYSLSPLIDVDGFVTGASVSVASTCVGCSGKNSAVNLGTTGDDELLLDDFQDLGVITSSATWTFSGLLPGRYFLYTYAWAPDGDSFRTTVEPVGSGDPRLVGGAWSGAHQEGVTYALHRVEVDGTGVLSVQLSTASAFGTLNGFQLVLQEPTGTMFCFGDGGDQMGCTRCRCLNEAPIGTIGGCLNGAATSARLDASGVPSLAADTLRFEVAGANPTTFAVLVSGRDASPVMGACPPGSGTLAGPALDGLRCVANLLVRHGTRATDGFGITVSNWGPPSGPAGGLIAQGGFAAGQTRYFQTFYRENPLASCMTGQNTSSAVSITFQP